MSHITQGEPHSAANLYQSTSQQASTDEQKNQQAQADAAARPSSPVALSQATLKASAMVSTASSSGRIGTQAQQSVSEQAKRLRGNTLAPSQPGQGRSAAVAAPRTAQSASPQGIVGSYQRDFYRTSDSGAEAARIAAQLLPLTLHSEGLKVLYLQRPDGTMHAISHSQSDAARFLQKRRELPGNEPSLPDHYELYKSLAEGITAPPGKHDGTPSEQDRSVLVAKLGGAEKVAAENRQLSKDLLMASVRKKRGYADFATGKNADNTLFLSGLRLIRLDGNALRFKLTESAGFGFLGASANNLKAIATFYVNVMRAAQTPIGVVVDSAEAKPSIEVQTKGISQAGVQWLERLAAEINHQLSSS